MATNSKYYPHKRKKKPLLSWTFLKYFLIACITIITLFLAAKTALDIVTPEAEVLRYAEGYEGVIQESEYIISEKMVLHELQQKAQIVSYEQDLFKTETHIDKGWFGTRETELEMHGTYKMGLNTEDIIVKHLDPASHTVYIELPKPEVIALEVPYDQLSFDKEKGWLRLAMDEEEQKTFYRSAINSIRTELSNDLNILKTADLYNQQVIKELLSSMSEIKTVVFEDGDWRK